MVDVLVDGPGEFTLEHRTPDRSYPLAGDHRHRGTPRSRRCGRSSSGCVPLRSWSRNDATLDRWLAAPPDKVLAIVATMDMSGMDDMDMGD